MGKNYEYEAKMLIAENDFKEVLDQYPNITFITQVNYYLDYDNTLKNMGMALRIREKNGIYEITTKTKIDDGNLENNINIDKDTVELILQTKQIPSHLIKTLQLPISTITTIKEIKTKRFLIPYHDYTVEMDFNTFNTTNDYELEIEAPSLSKAQEIMNCFLDEHHIKGLDSKPKIARYDIYNKDSK